MSVNVVCVCERERDRERDRETERERESMWKRKNVRECEGVQERKSEGVCV